MTAQQIRPHVLGVVRREESVLVTELVDPGEGPFYRPPGGGIEFGETSEEAVVREFREEMGVAVEPVRFLGIYENRFEWDGEPRQELAVVHEVAFADEALYDRETFHGVDAGGETTYETEWATVPELEARDEPLYPEDLGALVDGEAHRIVS